MAERSVTIRLKADIADFQAKMRAAGVSAKNALGRELDTITGDKKQALNELGNTAGKIGAVAAAGFGLAVGAAANFDEAMSHVAATGEDARANIDAMREAALQAGQDTAFSATEAAGGLEALAKAGVSAEDALGGGLQGALDLAAAGTIDVQDAAEAAATAMSQFGLEGEDVPHIADLLAAAAGKAQGEVSDMNYALAQSGLVANQVGLSIEETTGGLAAFANAGLLGSDAGTSLKTMLGALTPNSDKAAEAMSELGINAYDAQGNFVGLAEFAGNLQTALAGMSDEQRQATLETIFGSDAVRAASVLYEQGESGIREWIDAVDDQGYAAETAATKLDNLKGDLEALKGSLETALIGAGEGSQGMLRGLTQGLTGAVNKFNEMPPAAQNVTTAMLGITAITGGALWFGSKVVQGITETRAALVALGFTADTTKAKLATLGTGAAVAAVGIGTLFDTLGLQDSLSRSGDAAKATAEDYQELADALGKSNVGKYAQDLGIDINRLAEDLIVNGKSGEYASEVLKQLKDDSHGFSAAAKDIAGNALPFYTASSTKAYAANDDLKNIIENSSDALGQGESALTGAAGATEEYATASEAAAAAAEAEATSIQATVDAMRAKREEALKALDGELGYAQAVLDANDRIERRKELLQELAEAETPEERARIREELADYARTLDTTTQAGVDNLEVLSNMARAWNDQDDAAKNAKGAYKEARQGLIDTAIQFGATKKQAKEYADKLLEIPPKVATEIAISATVEWSKTNVFDKNGEIRNIGLINRADGGPVVGPGTGTSDSIPAWLSNGEHVLTAAEVSAAGGHDEIYRWRRSLRGYAAGGEVFASRPSPSMSSGVSAGLDMDQLVAAVARHTRPIYGDIYETPHDYGEFKRERARDMSMAGSDGVRRG